MQQAKTVVHQVLADFLPELGATHIFGLVGDANLFLVKAFTEAEKGHYIACTHEVNAVLAALGFAQATGKTGVATVTHGPALTNICTPLAEGVKGGIPMVVLCGDTPPLEAQHLQNIDQREVVAATGAGFVEMRSPETATSDLERAFRLAHHQRRPIVFNMRVDMQWEQAAEAEQNVCLPDSTAGAARGEALEESVGMMASARRPMILAGRGAMGDRNREAILKLARRLEAPVATTLKAQGLFHNEAFDLGIMGGLSHQTAVETIVQSDCIIAFGASLSKHTTEDGAYLRNKHVIQVMPDTQETPRLATPSLRLIGDLAETAEAMMELLDMAEIPGSGATDEELQIKLEGEAQSFAKIPRAKDTRPGTVDMVPALRRLHQALPAKRALVTDLGRFVTTAWRNFPVRAPHDLIYSCHFGAIGCGLGEAIGVAATYRKYPTVLVAGDGGFLLSGLSELSTAVRENMDLVIVLCNDGSYGAEHVQLANRQMNTELSMITPANFSAIAAAMGIRSMKVTDEETLASACSAVRERNGPTLIDIHLDPDNIEM